MDGVDGVHEILCMSRRTLSCSTSLSSDSAKLLIMVLAYGKATLVIHHTYYYNGACLWQGNISVIRHTYSSSSSSSSTLNVKFATFEEAGRLCKTIPQNGVKVAPLGGRSVLKLPH